MSTSTTSAYTSDTHFLAAARRGQHGVRIPRRWRDVLDAQEFALLVVLHSMRSTGTRFVVVGQRTIAAKLGRDPEARTDHVGRVAKRLENAGAIATTRTGRGTGITRYQLVEQTGDYDVIPWPLLRALEAGECRPGEIRTYAFLDQAMGAYGWTCDTSTEIAAAAGVASRTVRRHVACLELLEVLAVQTVAAAPGVWMLKRPDQAPRDEPAVDDDPVEAPSGVTHQADQARDTDVGGPDTDVGSIGNLAPEALAPEKSSPSRSDRHLGERAQVPPSGLRPKGGVFSAPGCKDVLRMLSGTIWREASDRRWLGGVLSKAVIPALESGMTPAAIGWALIDHGEDELLERPTSHIPIARQAIAEVHLDIRLGHACRLCGQVDDVIDGTHRECASGAVDVDRLDPACTPTTHTSDPEETTQIPLDERLATYLELEMTTAQVAEIDPEAATQIGDAT